MGWTLVQSKDSATGTCQFSSNTTTGNQIVVVNNAGAGATSVSISPGGGTFTKANGISVSGIVSEIWVCPNVTGGVTPTVTISGGSAPGPTCYEFSGGTGTLDGTTSNTGAATLVSTTSITTTQAGDLVIKGFAVFGTPTGAPQSGWTEVNPTLNGNISGYTVQSAAGAITGTDNQTGGTLNYCGVIAALKAIAGLSITPGGIASTNAFGTATVAGGAVNIAPTGIASTNAFGNPTLLASYSLSPSGIASTNVFGSATISASAPVSGIGIGSATAFGNPAVNAGAVNISPTGIGSTTAFGTAAASFNVISPTGIGSTIGFGNPTIMSTSAPSAPVARVNPVYPYAGQNQSAQINVPARIAYKYIDWEESCWVMPPYAIFYPGPPPMLLPMRYPAPIPAQSVGRIRWVSGFFQ